MDGISVRHANHPTATQVSYSLQAKLFGKRVEGDLFGGPMALDGDTAVVGDTEAGTGTGQGAYVFARTAGRWVERAKLTPHVHEKVRDFGTAVAISGDTIVVGADGDNSVLPQAGAAFVFVRNDEGAWIQQAKLVASNPARMALFGNAVDIDGDTIIVGAPGTVGASGTHYSAGSAYVFVRRDEAWSQEAQIFPSDGRSNNYFGQSVAVSQGTAIVGAITNHDAFASGSAYVFTRTDSGAWLEDVRLAPDEVGAFDYFGYKVAIDQDTAIVGSRLADADGIDSGAADVFVRSAGQWSQQARMMGTDVGSFDSFGSGVAVAGNTAIVGAGGHDDSVVDSGAAYVFVRTDGAWAQVAKLITEDTSSLYFGSYVAISGDTAAVAAPGEDDSRGVDVGAVYVFIA